MDLADIRKFTAQEAPRILIHGAEGVGKTTIASKFPAPIFLQTEDGCPSGMEINSFGLIGNFADLRSALGALASEQHHYQTVVIDSLDATEGLIWNDACRSQGWSSIESPGYGKGYVIVDSWWIDILKGFDFLRRRIGMSVVLLAHSAIETINAAQKEAPPEKILNIIGELRFLTATGPTGATASLEKIVRGGKFVNLVTYANKLLQFRRRVCRVEGNKIGTGFLVGPDLVLTNYHVVDDYINGMHDTKHLAFRFDYAVEGKGENPGAVKTLAASAGLVAWSKYSDYDPGDQGGLPKLTELDFALLRLSEPIGNEQISGIAPDQENLRGWITVSSQPITLTPKDIIVILQHPKGDALKIAQGTVIAQNNNETRVRYDADTDEGSSGSPCFDADLNLVALHHGGDRAWRNPKFNQGIPIDLIVKHLAPRADVPRFWD